MDELRMRRMVKENRHYVKEDRRWLFCI